MDHSEGGSSDGQVLKGHVWLIQAKRYASAMRPEHVQAFAALCADRGAPGLFVHIGRTGRASHEVVARHGMVEIISGQRLLAVIAGAPIAIGGTAL